MKVRKKTLKRLLIILFITLAISIIYYFFNPTFPDVLWIALGTFSVLLIRELIVIFLETEKKG